MEVDIYKIGFNEDSAIYIAKVEGLQIATIKTSRKDSEISKGMLTTSVLTDAVINGLAKVLDDDIAKRVYVKETQFKQRFLKYRFTNIWKAKELIKQIYKQRQVADLPF